MKRVELTRYETLRARDDSKRLADKGALFDDSWERQRAAELLAMLNALLLERIAGPTCEGCGVALVTPSACADCAEAPADPDPTGDKEFVLVPLTVAEAFGQVPPEGDDFDATDGSTSSDGDEIKCPVCGARHTDLNEFNLVDDDRDDVQCGDHYFVLHCSVSTTYTSHKPSPKSDR